MAAGRWLPGDRYRLDNQVGVGRLTESWAGYDTRLDRDVMVRLIRPDLAVDGQLADRLADRLRDAARLELAGLARIYDMIDLSDDDERLVAAVFEPAVGPDLRQKVSAGGPMSSDKAVQTATEIAETLDEIHARGMSHGALSAASIGWCGDSRMMITDLGTGGAADAPSDETPRGDIVALACIVHELVAGRPPHNKGGHLELDPSVPVELASPLDDALSAGSNFTSASALVKALAGATRARREPTTFAETERRWLLPVFVVVGIGLALAVVGTLLSRTEAGRTVIDGARGVVGLEPVDTTTTTTTTTEPLVTTTTAPLSEIAIVQIVDFDPEGDDRSESPRRLALINDGDPTRGWQTERYTTAEFGNLKSGVGLLVDLEDVAEFDQIVVRSPSRGWAMQIYIGQEAAGLVDDWGDPVAEFEDIDRDVVLAEFDQGGRSILLWFTRLGEGPEHRVVVTDIEVTGRPAA